MRSGRWRDEEGKITVNFREGFEKTNASQVSTVGRILKF